MATHHVGFVGQAMEKRADRAEDALKQVKGNGEGAPSKSEPSKSEPSKSERAVVARLTKRIAAQQVYEARVYLAVQPSCTCSALIYVRSYSQLAAKEMQKTIRTLRAEVRSMFRRICVVAPLPLPPHSQARRNEGIVRLA
jgi:hypothetical protein